MGHNFVLYLKVDNVCTPGHTSLKLLKCTWQGSLCNKNQQFLSELEELLGSSSSCPRLNHLPFTGISSALLTVLPFKLSSKVTFIHPCISPSEALSMRSTTGHIHIMPHSKPCSTNSASHENYIG